jgi:exonuclease VII large subunit
VKDDIQNTIEQIIGKMTKRMMMVLQTFNNRIALALQYRAFQNPMSMREQHELALSDIENRISLSIHKRLYDARESLNRIKDLHLLVKNRLQNYKHVFMMNASKVEHLSPVAVLKRGYSITLKGNTSVASDQGIRQGDEVKVIVYDGSMNCEVQSTSNEVNFGKKS